MKPKISIITLGVENLDAATHFYRDGLQLPEHQFDGDGISFFALSGTWLALYPHQALAEDIGIPLEKPTGYNGVTLAHNVVTKEEVDAVLAQAVAAGATLIKPAQSVFWGGYSGYFKDPEGYLWEVAYNPFTDLSWEADQR
ncbi:VOC family protein [Thaumasiovibrio subtropicus]|uniref:VOC family protein n=1 Tax=Thaumasiovibrio subtropicus TaxID=1891207 RepID=UPI000B35F91D|nr:VOC family protein [Thaumasiovibrio subtropicus]